METSSVFSNPLDLFILSFLDAKEKHKERMYLSVTWLKWLPTGMESKTRVTSKSNKVNSQKF